jgi:chemotaxis protein CheX
MDVKIINPFLNSTINVIKTMATMDVTPGKPTLKHGNRAFGVVTGLIGLAGDNAAGNLVLSFDQGSILGIVSSMLYEKFTEVNKDVVDAVGELTNMICGGAKAELVTLGYSIRMATPVMLLGKDVEVSQLTTEPVVMIPMKVSTGNFVVEAKLSKTE